MEIDEIMRRSAEVREMLKKSSRARSNVEQFSLEPDANNTYSEQFCDYNSAVPAEESE